MQTSDRNLTEELLGDQDWEETFSEPMSWAMTATGGALLLMGLKRRGLFGTAMAALGGVLMYRGMTSSFDVEIEFESSTEEMSEPMSGATEARGQASSGSSLGGAQTGRTPEWGEHREASPGSRAHLQAGPEGKQTGRAPESADRVRDESEESFPASDPPSWTPGRA